MAQRPRTVHIDVYCTDSDSQSESGTNSQPEAGSDSEQSTTSSCYTVVRPGFRHIRKKKGLPNAMTSASGERKLPILSYRISGKDLADAIERKRRQSSSVDTMDEDLFRNATLTDSSILWADSDAESVACSNSSFDNPPHPPPEALKKSWRSPEDERRRKRMLELRKEQWRASKAAEALPAAIHPPPNASAPSMAHLSIRTTDSLDNSCASGRSVSPRVSPRVSRVPTMLIRPPSGGELRSKSLSASIPARPIRIPAKVGKKADESEMPWQWRNRPDYIRTHPVTLKKFGHHVGPSRNPECGCVHCVEYHRVRSLKNPN